MPGTVPRPGCNRHANDKLLPDYILIELCRDGLADALSLEWLGRADALSPLRKTGVRWYRTPQDYSILKRRRRAPGQDVFRRFGGHADNMARPLFAFLTFGTAARYC